MTDGKGKACPECGGKVLTKAEICPKCVANSSFAKYQQSTIAKKAVDYSLRSVGVGGITQVVAGFVVRRAAKFVTKKLGG